MIGRAQTIIESHDKTDNNLYEKQAPLNEKNRRVETTSNRQSNLYEEQAPLNEKNRRVETTSNRQSPIVGRAQTNIVLYQMNINIKITKVTSTYSLVQRDKLFIINKRYTKYNKSTTYQASMVLQQKKEKSIIIYSNNTRQSPLNRKILSMTIAWPSMIGIA